MKARWQGGPHLKQVDDETSNSARISKMTTMPPIKTTKLYMKRINMGEVVLNFKLCFARSKWNELHDNHKKKEHNMTKKVRNEE